jgi:phosphoglycerol transferase MdoB-like AlkP superfamily enzyme
MKIKMDTMLILVVVIGMLNLIALYSMKDWNAIAVFLVVATAVFFATKNPLYMLIAAMVTSSLYRASKMMEGFEEEKPKKKKKLKPKEPEAYDDAEYAAEYKAEKRKPKENVFDMTEEFGNLQKNNETLLNNIKALTPLMKQSGELFKAMPPQLMAKALKNFGKKRV